MKRKNKKLRLDRTTIKTLTEKKLEGVAGGGTNCPSKFYCSHPYCSPDPK